MTRRRSGRRPGRRVEAARREERAPASPPHYGDVERRLVEEVLYLHSLWRSGPPTPALHPGGGSFATHVRADRRKRRRLERRAEPEDPDPDWPLAPSPPASPSPGSWPDAPSSTPTQEPPPPQPSAAWLEQRTGLRAAEEFFSGHTSNDDETEGSESEDEEDVGDAAEGFFLGLFERDAELRGYYERSYEVGQFVCMGCVGRKERKGRARRFRDCVSLVQHARAATRCGRRRAHRALASTVCRVLGWDIERLPSIVIDPRGTLGQALARKDAAATSREAKENADTSDNDDEDAAKEDDGLGKKSSSNDKEEDVDSGMNGSPLRAGAATKEDVDTMKSGTSSNGNDREAHEQENVTETAEKDDTDPLGSKDTPMELRKSVQEEEGAIDNKQEEHAKSADDMGDICNVKLENNSSKEEAATENKQEHTNNVVGTGDGDIGSLGHNLIDSTKVPESMEMCPVTMDYCDGAGFLALMRIKKAH